MTLGDAVDAVDLFSGPGGWDLAAETLGIRTLGIEHDDAAVATRAAVGLRTVQADVSELDPNDYRGVEGAIFSPPCPAFSAAGARAGIEHLPELLDAIARRDWTALRDLDPEIWLPLEVGRWIEALAPRWIACEQVPPAGVLWRAYEPWLRERGYSVWTGVLCAADFGVPQVRFRAFMLASLDVPAHPPAPTHAETPAASLFGPELLPWVSMAVALGISDDVAVEYQRGAGMTERHGERRTRRADEPAPVVTAGGSRYAGGPRWALSPAIHRKNRRLVPIDEPAPTLNFGHSYGSWLWKIDGVDVEPPRLALPIVGMNTGRDWKPGGSREDAQTIPIDDPAPTVSAVAGQSHWIFDRPATTIAGDPRVFSPGGHIAHDGRDNSKMVGRSENAISVTEDQAAVLQSFPVGYPWAGNKRKRFEQIGNAVPPLLAFHVLAAITGRKTQ